MTNYTHNHLYVYDAESQTFTVPENTMLQELETAIAQCFSEEYTAFVSFYGKRINVSLTKRSSFGDAPMALEVKAEGSTVTEAFTRAFANFPKNPLDGASKWNTNRLKGPVEDAVYTDLPK